MKIKRTSSRLTDALLETAGDMHRAGITKDATSHKITARHLGPQAGRNAKPISGEEIRVLRERANMSQAVFARYLNLTVGYVSQLERGVKEPKGPALTLLNVIRRNGFEVIL